MLPDKIAFVDIETTGTRSYYDRVIEIGILRVENNKIEKTFSSLINPQTYIPKEITMITGITSDDLENAPTFRQVKEEILEMLIDAFFVAHNVRFDYGFLINEFKRENISFTSRHFCTVRLSRLLYPQHRHHNLDALIERHNLPCANRHRALDDAAAIYHFYKNIQSELPPEKIDEALAICLKKPSLPPKLSQEQLENMPEKPGVYIFYAEKGSPLYVGKSKNIKERVLNHFSSDIHSPTEMKISQQIESIETITTTGELGALLLESQLIKELLPLYNKKSRLKKELVGIKSEVNDQGYKICNFELVKTITPENMDTFLGFFKSRKQAKAFLAEIAKKFSLCEKLLGLENTKNECFAYRLKRCKGACAGIEKPLIYNLRFLAAFASGKIKSWPFKGPILIKEQEFSGTTEYFLINNWCYMGNIVIDPSEGRKNNFMEKMVFDLDIYHILSQFFRNPNNLNNIKVLSTNTIPGHFAEDSIYLF